MKARGVLPSCERIFEWKGAPIKPFLAKVGGFAAPGAPSRGLTNLAPGMIQVHAPLPAETGKVTVKFSSRAGGASPNPLQGQGTPFTPVVLVKFGKPLTWTVSLGEAKHDADATAEPAVSGVRESAFDVPAGVTDVRELDYEAERGRFFRPKNIEHIERLSVEFCRALGLRYAGLDWAVEPSGKLWLFEANPCGSFRWFEEVGAGPITAAIATALLEPAKRP